jgi:drug/metabolite transporter (DMT)-like permease
VLGVVSIVLVSQQTAPDQGEHGAALPGRLPAGMPVALVSGVAIGFFFLALAQTRPEAGMWPIVVARTLSSTFFGALVLARRQSLRMAPPVLLLVLMCGAVDMFANALYLLAARQGPLSVVVTLSSLYPASTVLLARVVLAERLNTLQITGVACALGAIVLIVSGGRG